MRIPLFKNTNTKFHFNNYVQVKYSIPGSMDSSLIVLLRWDLVNGSLALLICPHWGSISSWINQMICKFPFISNILWVSEYTLNLEVLGLMTAYAVGIPGSKKTQELTSWSQGCDNFPCFRVPCCPPMGCYFFFWCYFLVLMSFLSPCLALILYDSAI